MEKERLVFRNRILLLMLVPVFAVGFLISVASVSYLTPPLLSFLQSRTDAELKLASGMGLNICENSFNYLLEGRLENEPEMNAAMKKEAIERVKRVSRRFYSIQMLIVKSDGTAVASTLALPQEDLSFLKLHRSEREIATEEFFHRRVRMHARYFPFWDWHILSLIFEKDYMEPLTLVRKIGYLGTLGVLAMVLMTFLVVFHFLVNLPLRKVIRATEGVAEGRFDRVDFSRKDEVGRMIHAFNSMVEALERKNGEVTDLIEALRDSESRFRIAFQTSPDPMTISRLRDGMLVDVNEGVTLLSGYNRDDLIGKSTLDIGLWEDPKDRERFLERLLKDGQVRNMETGLRPRDGTVRAGLVSARIITLNDEPHILTVARDIQELKEADRALRESEEKYRQVVHHANDAIFIAQDEVIKFPNPKTVTLVGYGADELAGIPFIDLIHPEDRELVLERHRRRLEGEELESTYSFRVIKKTGEEIWVQLNTAIIAWDERPATLNFLRDITHQKKLEDQLRHAQKMEAIGTLAGGIAHDFNNLLMGLQGRVSLMLMDTPRDHPHREYLRGMEEMIKTSSDLTKRLLGISRGGRYEVKSTDPNLLIRKSTDIFGRTRKEIQIREKFQEGVWTVEVDQGQMEQALLNLYVNAWQAMPAGGSLYLETANVDLDQTFVAVHGLKPGRYVRISVTDTGVGMDEKIQARIFDPFFTTKEMGRGTGLDLASAYGIVKNHGGIIQVHSKRGEGSTFHVYIPASGKKPVEEKRTPENILKGMETVLLVDDEESLLAVGEQMLAALGYKVCVARGGKEAVEFIRKTKREKENGASVLPDLIILDMIMPGVGGREAYEMIKTIVPEARVLLSSGYSIDGQATEILKRGCDGFIQKPFNLEQLSKKIREVLDMPVS